jgi:Zn-dependent peptidase ImmA (M78 family)
MISHMKETWRPNSDMVYMYDCLIKDMVMNANLDLEAIFDLVKAFVHILDAQIGQKTVSITNARADIEETRETISEE